jgi:cytochrome c553
MTLKQFVRFSLMAIVCVGPRLHGQQPDAGRVAAQLCASCHGPRGQSISPAFPRLAGQQQVYLEIQLKAFRDRTRGDPMAQAYHWGMTPPMTDETIGKLAVYYSEQKPVLGKAGDPTLVQTGRVVYEQGIPAASVPKCLTCHGKDAEGSVMFPRLAGQHAEYLLERLVMFKSELPSVVSLPSVSRTNAPIMHNISAGVTFDQMRAVATYLMSR